MSYEPRLVTSLSAFSFKQASNSLIKDSMIPVLMKQHIGPKLRWHILSLSDLLTGTREGEEVG